MRILSLCDYTANILKPWAKAGHSCIAVDIAYDNDHVDDLGIVRLKRDIRNWRPDAANFNIIFAFPPCTHLAASGARWWQNKGLRNCIEALELVEHCLIICKGYIKDDGWWLIENPVGRLSTTWRKPDHTFDPCDYGDPYTKKTCLWTGGSFVMPPKDRVEPTKGSMMHKLPANKQRARIRMATPPGFADAVFVANYKATGDYAF